MITLLIDVMRSSVTKPAQFNTTDSSSPYSLAIGEKYRPLDLPAVDVATGAPPLMMYVMPHFVGNHPASWRRQFYGDIAHGVKIFE